ncbi:hypothetical protein B0H13DRAFT_1855138 [Mycena leptocephala]|nr:hypothetical protein B0H13DRAFT_1855138 [Mycena leptocephala]
MFLNKALPLMTSGPDPRQALAPQLRERHLWIHRFTCTAAIFVIYWKCVGGKAEHFDPTGATSGIQLESTGCASSGLGVEGRDVLGQEHPQANTNSDEVEELEEALAGIDLVGDDHYGTRTTATTATKMRVKGSVAMRPLTMTSKTASTTTTALTRILNDCR